MFFSPCPPLILPFFLTAVVSPLRAQADNRSNWRQLKSTAVRAVIHGLTGLVEQVLRGEADTCLTARYDDTLPQLLMPLCSIHSHWPAWKTSFTNRSLSRLFTWSEKLVVSFFFVKETEKRKSLYKISFRCWGFSCCSRCEAKFFSPIFSWTMTLECLLMTMTWGDCFVTFLLGWYFSYRSTFTKWTNSYCSISLEVTMVQNQQQQKEITT